MTIGIGVGVQAAVRQVERHLNVLRHLTVPALKMVCQSVRIDAAVDGLPSSAARVNELRMLGAAVGGTRTGRNRFTSLLAGGGLVTGDSQNVSRHQGRRN